MYTVNKDKSVTVTNSAYQSYSTTYVVDDAGTKLSMLTTVKRNAFGKLKSDELELSIVTDMVTRECQKLRQEFAINNDPTFKYTPQEVATFPTLQAEYFDGVKTPYVDALAASRGITRVEMLRLIGLKVTAVCNAQGALYKKMDTLKAATTAQGVLDALALIRPVI